MLVRAEGVLAMVVARIMGEVTVLGEMHRELDGLSQRGP